MAGPTRQRPGANTPGTVQDRHRNDQVSPEATGTAHLGVAMATAAAGWPVFPCLPDKKPATRRGFHDAHTDPDRIRRWWARHPGHLVGTPTEGLVVVDLDEHPDAPGAAWDWWAATAGARGWEPTDAPMVATPRGGVHVYYLQPEGADVRNSASKVAPGVDIRGNGGYVIAPGSTLPDGRRYDLLEPHPHEVPVAPAWLVELAQPARLGPVQRSPRPATGTQGSRYGLVALEAELGRLATAAEGTRNETLNRAAYRCGQLVAGGEVDPHHAIDQLAAVALRVGLGGSEAEATIASGMRSGARSPRRRAA